MARSTLQPSADYTAQPVKDLTSQKSNLSNVNTMPSEVSTADQVNSRLASSQQPEKYLDKVAQASLK